jgi:serine/threonine protein phosphatase PrpC
MKYLWTALTDIGGRKENQDSLFIRQAYCYGKTILLAVVCDGMGGLKKGEVASAALIREFVKWFDEELPILISMKYPENEIRISWHQLIQRMNDRMNEYARKNCITLGTTLTAMLFQGNRYELIHVGDSRAYEINKKAFLLTKDQTLAEYEIACGRMRRQDIERDRRRHILMQSVGGYKKVEPIYRSGKIRPSSVYLLCSDGFCHLVTDRELQKWLHPKVIISEKILEQRCRQLVDLNKQRGEQDNISVIAIRT